MEGQKHTYHLPHTEELQKKVLKLEEKPMKASDKHNEESNPEEIAREEEDKEEMMENPASLYG